MHNTLAGRIKTIHANHFKPPNFNCWAFSAYITKIFQIAANNTCMPINESIYGASDATIA